MTATGTAPAPGTPPTPLRDRWEEAVDQLVGSDPGLIRLRQALQAVTTIGVALAADYGFVKVTGALQTTVPAGATAAERAAAASGNHALLVIALLLGALVGMLSVLGVNDTTARRQVVSVLIVPVPVVGAMALGLSLGGHRALALASFPVLLMLGTLARRWGQRGTLIGMPLFVGDFIGFFLYGVVHFGDLGWIAAEVVIGALASIAVRLVLFFPDAGAALRRSQRSWEARARTVAAVAETTFAQGPGTDAGLARQLRRRLVRLNEAALMIDAQLAEPGALPDGSSAQQLHERLFDAELGLTNAARFAEALRRVELSDAERVDVAGALRALRSGDLADATARAAAIQTRLGVTAADELGEPGAGADGPHRPRRVLLHRFATSVSLAADALDEWMAMGMADDDATGAVFVPAVTLAGGWLPGSGPVSAETSQRSGGHGQDRLALPPYVRTAVQIGIAVGLSVVVGDVVSGRRFYWAVIAAFVSFTGVNTSMEQVRKAAQRVAGTVVGIVIGSAVAHVDGTSDILAVVAVLVSMFFAIYLIRVSYAFMVIGITVMISQLYEQLGELSNSVLLLRLGETAIGAVIAMATVVVVLPLRMRRVLAVALADLLRATSDLVAEALRELAEPGRPGDLATRARAVDLAYQTVVVTARPLRRLGESGRWAQRVVSGSSGLRHYARNLVRDVPMAHGAAEGEAALLAAAGEHLLGSIGLVADVFDGAGGDGPFVRSASRWSTLEQHALDALRRAGSRRADRLPDAVEVVMAARDLQLLDAALAELAALAGLDVQDLDTGAEPPLATHRSGHPLGRHHPVGPVTGGVSPSRS
jgi:uncharacterized membrane protein YgaE (UPF0421/DUF939 family)